MVGAGDAPIFELEVSSDSSKEDRSQLKHFILHAALDNVDEIMWSNPSLYEATTSPHTLLLTPHPPKNTTAT